MKPFAHAIAAAVVVGCLSVTNFAVFLGLLVWSITAGGPIAVSLVLPGMIVLLGVAATVFAILPAAAAAPVLCERVLNWPRAAQLPIAAALCFVEVLIVAAALVARTGSDVARALAAGSAVGLVAVVLLGIYWWVLHLVGGGRRTTHEAPPRPVG